LAASKVTRPRFEGYHVGNIGIAVRPETLFVVDEGMGGCSADDVFLHLRGNLSEWSSPNAFTKAYRRSDAGRQKIWIGFCECHHVVDGAKQSSDATEFKLKLKSFWSFRSGR
jgi:hypothetical protein